MRTKHTRKRIAVFLLMILAIWLALPRAIKRAIQPAAQAATIFTVVNTNDSSGGSLRQAILDANANPGADTINFNIPGSGVQTISLLSALPPLNDTVTIDGYTQPGASANTLPIGDNAQLLIELNGAAAGAGANGLTIQASNCVVRGLVINRFSGSGIADGTASTFNNVIEGNFIGVNPAGNAALGNNTSGSIFGAGVSFKAGNGNGVLLSSGNRVGGTTPASRNVISGNDTDGTLGVYMLVPSGSTGAPDVVQGNYIGTDASGTVAVKNANGVTLNNFSTASGATIGGSDPGAGNVISGNSFDGVFLNAPGVLVQGNLIGTDANGTSPLGNSEGVLASGVSATGNIIRGNTIAFNPRTGVRIHTGTGNGIFSNSIFSNGIQTGGLGIDLDPVGITPNDAGDSDSGSNNLQNFPVLTSAAINGGSTTVQGTLNSTPSTSYQLEFFSNVQCNASGNGEGQHLIGSISVMTDSSGNASFNVVLTQSPANGQWITATATDPNNNTSEFSACRLVSGGTAVQFAANSFLVGEGSGHVDIAVTRSGDTSGSATVDYTTSDFDTFAVGCAAKRESAFGRCDFATVAGTLSFAPGEMSKTFSVPIIDDSYAEGDEIFSVVLSNPSGAVQGPPPKATVTIIDNESSDGPNPIFQTNPAGVSFFVRQHYLDFLGREPEPGEPWSAILNGCANQFNTDPNSPSAGCDRINVSGNFFGSPEFKTKGIYVIDSYRVAFNRLPTYSEFAQDLASVTGTTAPETNARRAAFAAKFVLRPEFASTYGAQSNPNFVNALMAGSQGQNYNLSSITTPDPENPDGGMKVTLTTTDLINQLDGGTLTRAQVLRAIVQSDQITQNFESVNAFVASQYFGYLRRTPDNGGFNNWVTYLKNNPSDFRTMVNGFLNSNEYRLRFGPL